MDDFHENLHLLAFKFFEKDRGLQLPSDGPDVASLAMERRRAGRYTLEEAALFVAINARARANNILNGMLDSIARRTLTIHQPWLNEAYLTDVVRPWRDEVYGDAMNDWLEVNHPKIGRVFPDHKADVLHGNTETISDEPLPGKLPNVAVGELAVRAAVQIEQKSKRSTSAKPVIELLQKWADEGLVPDVLLESNKSERGVVWLTSAREERLYTVEACQRTLSRWKESLKKADSSSPVKTVAPP